jgi:hypothetical protein
MFIRPRPRNSAVLRRVAAAALGVPGRLHRNEQGVMSIFAVFSVLVFTMLLGMVMNVGRHADVKIRMQNAADAAAYSGGITLARAMNTLAFTNHLLCEVFALTAFYQEAQPSSGAQQSDTAPLANQILAEWTKIAQVLSSASANATMATGAGAGTSYQQLGTIAAQKEQLEAALVTGYDSFINATSPLVLPTFEEILGIQPQGAGQNQGGGQGQGGGATQNGGPIQGGGGGGGGNPTPDQSGGQGGGQGGGGGQPQGVSFVGPYLITQFQQALITTYPLIAQAAVSDVATRDAKGASGEGYGALWNGSGVLVVDAASTTLPVVDPSTPSGSGYLKDAQNQRQYYAHIHLDAQTYGWNYRSLGFFGNHRTSGYATLSQYYNIYRTFDCGYLEQLLTQCSNANLPMMFPYKGYNNQYLDLTQGAANPQAVNSYLDQHFNFVAVVYWNQMPEMMSHWLRSWHDSSNYNGTLYRNAAASDAMAYAQVQVYVPQLRFRWYQWPNLGNAQVPGGGASGNIGGLGAVSSGTSGAGNNNPPIEYYVNLQSGGDSRCPSAGSPYWCNSNNPLDIRFTQTVPNYPWIMTTGHTDPWSLWNQNWTAQLVPTSVPALAQILQSSPKDISGEDATPPSLGQAATADLLRISPH